MRGNITRRGRNSWRLKFDLGRDPKTGERITRLVTVRGKRQDAERELTKLLHAAGEGTLVDASTVTIAEYINAWLGSPEGLTPKTLERYRQIVAQQIVPHLGAIALQKLRPAQVQAWHGTILKSGGRGGRPLSPRTVGQAHKILHRALARAAAAEIVARNVASVIRPPKVEHRETACLAAGQIAEVLIKLGGHALYPIVAVAVGTGARRGELLALRWSDVDLDGATVRVERSLEETDEGLRFKSPKTKHGVRTVSLPSSAVDALRLHRRQQLERRLALGLGRPAVDALVFSMPDGSPMSPDALSSEWRRVVKTCGLPKITFHALRHSHVSALVAAGLDVVAISRRLGHGSPATTLSVYAHMFEKTDAAAAQAIDAAMRTRGER
jgi:integrase